MNSIHQPCPHCERMLELPAAATGRQGQCPACETTFTIGVQQTLPTQTDPVEPIDSPHPTQPIPIEDIVSDSLSLFAERWTSLAISGLIVAAVTLLATLVPLWVISAIGKAGANGLAGFLALLWILSLIAVETILGLGLVRIALAIARGQSKPLLGQFIPPTRILVRSIALMFLFAAGLAVVIFLLVIVFGGLGEIAGNPKAAGLLSVLGIFLGGIMAAVAYWWFWSLPFFVCEGSRGLFPSIHRARDLTERNRLTSVLLISIMFVLTILGLALCLVGSILTVPLATLMGGVAYLKMTGFTGDKHPA